MVKSLCQVSACGLSHLGQVRTSNQDVWAIFPEERLFVLADGMGGHAGGETAAKEAVQNLYEQIRDCAAPPRGAEEGIDLFRDALAYVNRYIYEKGLSCPELKGMGTTLVSLVLIGREAMVAHVGDSRLYLLRDGDLTQVTEDHSLLSELLARGTTSIEEAENFPYKHILTRAIGTHPAVEPSFLSFEVKRGDLFMLCSDGLTNFASDSEITKILLQRDTLESKAKQLVDLANSQGGGDNITLVLVSVNDLS